MNVYCQIKFSNSEIHFDSDNLTKMTYKTMEDKKVTPSGTGQNPRWPHQTFTFGYQKLSKLGQTILANATKQGANVKENF